MFKTLKIEYIVGASKKASHLIDLDWIRKIIWLFALVLWQVVKGRFQN